MVTRNPRTTVPDDWLRTIDVARHFNVSPGTVFRWHCQGNLVGVTSQNARLRFDPAVVAAFDRAAHRKPHGCIGERNGRITITEAALVLGRSVSFVRTHANKGEIPHTRNATGVRLFDPATVEAVRTELEQRKQQDAALISFNEAARRLGYTGAAWVSRMVKRGAMNVGLDKNGVRRIPVSEVERVIAERGGVNGKAWRRKTTAKGW